MKHLPRQNLIFVSLSQFGMAFSNSFIGIIMPFFIFTITPYSPTETLLWVGIIMGVPQVLTVVCSNIWGSLTSRVSPKLLFIRSILANTLLFLLMGFTSNLYLLLILRLLQGVMAGVSTIGLIIVSASSSREKISADIGFYQTFLTLGLLIGPPSGSFAASVFGYRGAFVSASVLLVIVFLFCYFKVTDVPPPPRGEKLFRRGSINRSVILGWFLCFSATVQLMFLPSILPKVLEQFQIERAHALKWAGIIVMLYSGTATLGIYFWTRLARRFGRDRMITGLVLVGTLFQILLVFTHGITDFILIRTIQTGLIAACVPLVISIFATEMRGGIIGFLNSARFAGNAAGSLIATSLVAFFNLTTTYLFISALTLLALLGFRLSSVETEKDPSC
jgi:MFS transporter, DHA1 family, multidrug resistance protein